MRNILLILALIVGMAGCGSKVPVQKDWVPVDGSRAAATLKLSYQYNPQTEIPTVNDAQGYESAKQRCASWGYPEVEAFGGILEHCDHFRINPWTAQMECLTKTVTKSYQCLGRGDAVTPIDRQKP